MSMNSETLKRQWARLRNKEYRSNLVLSTLRQMIPQQISTLMQEQGFTQQELAKRSNLTQGVISRAVDPSYGKLTLTTIGRIASGLDMAFVGKFVPWDEFLRWASHVEADFGRVITFAESDKQLDFVNAALARHARSLGVSSEGSASKELADAEDSERHGRVIRFPNDQRQPHSADQVTAESSAVKPIAS